LNFYKVDWIVWAFLFYAKIGKERKPLTVFPSRNREPSILMVKLF